MDPFFGAHDAAQERDKVFVLAFDVLFLFGFGNELRDLQGIGRVVLVRDGNRYKLNFFKIGKAVVIFFRQGQHFEYALLCAVVTVFGSPFALSCPNGPIFPQEGFLDKLRYEHRTL